MRVAVIGSGISGLTAARFLHDKTDLTVFEANHRVGGHTNTVSVSLDHHEYHVDTGFIVFNDRTYPNFCRLLNDLNVASDATSMSFSVRCDADNLEYCGRLPTGLFAQKRNLLRPRFYRMLADIVRFNRTSCDLLQDTTAAHVTVAEFLRQQGYSREFARYYLLPMGAAIWSCPTSAFLDFPMQFIAEFYRNHGLLSLQNRPTWRVIRGGSKTYADRLTADFRNAIRLNCAVRRIRRHAHAVSVVTEDHTEEFDEVIFACHADQALKILGSDATPVECSVLNAFPFQKNKAILHTDTSVLPRRKNAWASWNYRIVDDPTHATLTYNMSMLQHIPGPHTFCVSLNQQQDIRPEKILAEFCYSHPIFTRQRSAAQQRHRELIRQNRTSFCGAYWGNGFHEDGVNSALAVVRAFAPSVPDAAGY